jgi:VRR-NUC domain
MSDGMIAAASGLYYLDHFRFALRWLHERACWIEVKGPGDRLQDNQQRWMEFCVEQNLPVTVCHVRWAAG